MAEEKFIVLSILQIIGVRINLSRTNGLSSVILRL